MPQQPFLTYGIHLYRLGDKAIVAVQIAPGGAWVQVIEEHVEGPFSHIVEPEGIRRYVAEHE